MEPLTSGYRLRVKLADGELVALLPTAPGPLTRGGLATGEVVVAARLDGAGSVRDRIRLEPRP